MLFILELSTVIFVAQNLLGYVGASPQLSSAGISKGYRCGSDRYLPLVFHCGNGVNLAAWHSQAEARVCRSLAKKAVSVLAWRLKTNLHEFRKPSVKFFRLSFHGFISFFMKQYPFLMKQGVECAKSQIVLVGRANPIVIPEFYKFNYILL